MTEAPRPADDATGEAKLIAAQPEAPRTQLLSISGSSTPAGRPVPRNPYDSLVPREAYRCAINVGYLLLKFGEWVQRRVESIELLDDTAVRRRVSVDFILPAEIADPAAAMYGGLCVPLTFLRKTPLRSFDMRDEQGRSLPVLTKEQNGGIVADAVTLLAEEVLGPRYAQEMPAIADVVRRVVQGSTEVAHQVYRQGGPAVESPVEDARLRRAWAVLRADTAFNDLLEILRDNFVLTAVLSEPHVARRILKFSYISDYAPNGQARASQRLRSWLGLRQTHLIFLTPTATLASSYHFELAAPRDLDILRVAFHALPDGDDAGEVQFGGTSTRIGSDDSAVGDVGHLDAPDDLVDDPGLATVPGVIADLRAQPRGLPRAAFLTAALIFLVLVAFHLNLTAVGDQNRSQIAAAVLLLGPTVFAAFLIRPDEHPLASRLLNGLRVLVLVIGATAVIGAVLTVLKPSGDTFRDVWWLLDVVAFVCATLLFFPAWRPSTLARIQRAEQGDA